MEIVLAIAVLYFMTKSSGKNTTEPKAVSAYDIAKNWNSIAQKNAAENGIDKNIILAIIAVESMGNPNAAGATNDHGLCQITPIALADYNQFYKTNYTVNQLYDPEVNVKICAGFLKLIFSRVMMNGYRVDAMAITIRAYNVGLSRAETNGFEYYEKVLGWYTVFQNLNFVG